MPCILYSWNLSREITFADRYKTAKFAKVFSYVYTVYIMRNIGEFFNWAIIECCAYVYVVMQNIGGFVILQISENLQISQSFPLYIR